MIIEALLAKMKKICYESVFLTGLMDNIYVKRRFCVDYFEIKKISVS